MLLKRIVTDQSSEISGLHDLNRKLEKHSSDSDAIVCEALTSMSRKEPEKPQLTRLEPNFKGALALVIAMPIIAYVIYLLSRL